MNTKDFPAIEPDGDMLKAIFEHQHKLAVKFNEIEDRNGLLICKDIPVNLHDRFGQDRLKSFAWRVTEELAEAMGCLKNRAWKLTHYQTDEDHYYEEIIDALHFFVELMILSGFTPESVYALYTQKKQVNDFRIRSRY